MEKGRGANEKNLFLVVSSKLSKRSGKMRAADLLTILTKSPKKTDYQGVFLAQDQKLIPVTRIQINESYQFIFLFEQGKAPLAMKEIFLFLMKNREKAVYYQSKEELIPLYGVKEIENKVVI